MRSIPGGFAVWAVSLCAIVGCGGGSGGTDPDPNAVATVVVAPQNSTITALGATTPLSAEARNASNSAVPGKTFAWTSLQPAIASVATATGVVTAVTPGTATIRATMSGSSISGTAQVTVQQAVSSVVIAQSQGTVAPGSTLQLSASARDAGSAPVSGAVIAWSSSNANIASVNTATGLVTGVQNGSVMITATSAGIFASIPVNVSAPPLVITKDTTIAGNVVVDGFTVAEGFTVTVNGPLTLRSGRRIAVAGTLSSACHAIDIVGDTAVSITGTVSNGCAAGAGGVPLRISATGELDLDGALIESSGEIVVANDPSLSPSSLAQQRLLASVGSVAGLAGIPSARISNTTIRYRGGGAGPDPASPGSNGVNGGNGDPAYPVYLLLDGNAQFAGNTLIWGQDGGAGGNGLNESTSDLTVTGGHGGTGGLLRLFVGGSLVYSGANNILRSGAGGAGGTAVAGTQQSATGSKAPGATATGGNGGDPGLVEIEAAAGIFVNLEGALAIEIGLPGNGGAAAATAADGMAGSISKAPQGGGDAIAHGGNGGSTLDLQLIKVGNVNGFQPLVRAPGGGDINGGNGGQARASAGNGGAGLRPNKNGAIGGNLNAVGGNGGMAALGGVNGAALGRGGNGGLAWFLRGNGGAGWSDCSTGDFESGGSGGSGGNASGSGGAAGTGRKGNGTAGGARFEGVSNGGSAGNGSGAGSAGQAGAKSVGATGGQQNVGLVVTAGAAGLFCPFPNNAPAADFYMQLEGWPANSLGLIGAGPYTRNLTTLAGTVVGSVVVTTMSANSTGYYVGRTPPARLGSTGANGWDLNLASVQLSGVPPAQQFPNIEFFALCFLNENPPPSPANPIHVHQRDNFGFVHVADVIDGPSGLIIDGRAGCRTFTKHLNTTHVRWFRSGAATAELDWLGLTKKINP